MIDTAGILYRFCRTYIDGSIDLIPDSVISAKWDIPIV